MNTKITNPTKLNIDYTNKFREKLENKLNHINIHAPIEETWKCFKERFLNTSLKTLPTKNKVQEKQWLTDEIKKLSVEKTKHHLRIRSLKQKGHTIPQGLISSYNNIKAQTKNACRNAIDHWWKVKAAEAERVTELSIKQGRGGSILKLLKLAKTSNIRSSANLKFKDGKLLICSSDEKINRWKEYFEDFAKTDTIVEAKLYDELIPGKLN